MKWHRLWFAAVPLLWVGYFWCLKKQNEVLDEILKSDDPAKDTGPSLALNGLVVVVGPTLVVLSIVLIGVGMILGRRDKKRKKG